MSARDRANLMHRRLAIVAAVAAFVVAGAAPGSTGVRTAKARNGPILYAKQVESSWDLFVADAQGVETSLTVGERPEWIGVWSPDRRAIVFIAPPRNRTGTNLFRMDADGSDVRRLAHLELGIVPDIALSPSGRRVAFSASPSTGPYRPSEIYSYALRSGKLRRLTRNAVLEGDPDWSPDGSTIAFDRNGVLWTMDADGRHKHRLGHTSVHGFEPAWSPAGDWIAFSTLDGDIFKVRPDGTSLRQLTRSFDRETTPVWSPDGTRIAYARSHYHQIIEEWFERIYRMHADGSGERRVTTAGADHPDW